VNAGDFKCKRCAIMNDAIDSLCTVQNRLLDIYFEPKLHLDGNTVATIDKGMAALADAWRVLFPLCKAMRNDANRRLKRECA